jgi:hypothetical protein
MNPPSHPGDESFDIANSQLDAGLRSCRAVVSNYRALLAGEGANDNSQAAFTEADDTQGSVSN